MRNIFKALQREESEFELISSRLGINGPKITFDQFIQIMQELERNLGKDESRVTLAEYLNQSTKKNSEAASE